jgi:ABC-type antimicrobial peptide transport system permease subunit
MTILLVFAGIGLVLSVIGIYGVLAQVARARTREMGIRIALGARGAQVRWLLVRHGLRLTAIGLGVGAVTALGATRALQSLLYGVATADARTFAAVGVLILATGLLAAWIPALKASRADPIVALRADQ